MLMTPTITVFEGSAARIDNGNPGCAASIEI